MPALLDGRPLLGVAQHLTPEQAQRIYDTYTEIIRSTNADRLSREEFLKRLPSIRYRPQE